VHLGHKSSCFRPIDRYVDEIIDEAHEKLSERGRLEEFPTEVTSSKKTNAIGSKSELQFAADKVGIEETVRERRPGSISRHYRRSSRFNELAEQCRKNRALRDARRLPVKLVPDFDQVVEDVFLDQVQDVVPILKVVNHLIHENCVAH
jgi:hypothetical protein